MIKLTRKLHKIDAKNQPLGRLASKIAVILLGKNRVDYLPYLDRGDIVQIENIKEIKLSGKKESQKKYYSYSGYPGGLKTKKISDMPPAKILQKAVKDMLPPTKRRTNLLKRIIFSKSENA